MGVSAILEPHSSTKTNCLAGSWLTSALQAARSCSLRSEAPNVFFCASSLHGEWRDSSWCDPPTCHECFPTAGSGLGVCYLDAFPVARPVQLEADAYFLEGRPGMALGVRSPVS